VPSKPAQAGLEPRHSAPQGGNTGGPAEPVPRCSRTGFASLAAQVLAIVGNTWGMNGTDSRPIAIVAAMQKDSNPGVRVRAIDTLASRRDRRLLPVMERLSRDDPDAYVRMRSGAFVDALYASNSTGNGQ